MEGGPTTADAGAGTHTTPTSAGVGTPPPNSVQDAKSATTDTDTPSTSPSPSATIPSAFHPRQGVSEANEGGRGRGRKAPPKTQTWAGSNAPAQDFATIILTNLQASGIHQAEKQDRITFTSITGWDGNHIAARATYEQGAKTKTAAIFIGPEYGTITHPDIMAAAREANDARFDILVATGFNFDAHSSEIDRLGPLPILKARINPDLHMANDLKDTPTANAFTLFGEPDITYTQDKDGNITVTLLGIDVFDPQTGKVRASDKNEIAAWFIDTNYNEESFFVRHAYFLGANDPYKSLKTSLKAEIDHESWATLYRDTSRPFPHPPTGRFAVKVINHFGDEALKTFIPTPPKP